MLTLECQSRTPAVFFPSNYVIMSFMNRGKLKPLVHCQVPGVDPGTLKLISLFNNHCEINLSSLF